MDTRYSGHFGRFFENLSRWAKQQSKNGLWERNARFYIPSYHGSYDDFAREFQESMKSSDAKAPDLYVHEPAEDEDMDDDADLITFFPIFEVAGTLWSWRNYLVNYNVTETNKPRRGTVNTNMRLSRRLLTIMHQENREGRSMMSEMWPTTIALHHGLKAVYAPHPMFLERRWPAESLERVFNAGKNGQVGGSLNTVLNQDHNFGGATWFWNARFAADLYTKWIGKAVDGAGSPEWQKVHGPLCLPTILMHPVKAHLLPT